MPMPPHGEPGHRRGIGGLRPINQCAERQSRRPVRRSTAHHLAKSPKGSPPAGGDTQGPGEEPADGDRHAGRIDNALIAVSIPRMVLA